MFEEHSFLIFWEQVKPSAALLILKQKVSDEVPTDFRTRVAPE